jgi:hypothetical protein
MMSFDESKLALYQLVKSSFLCIVLDIQGIIRRYILALNLTSEKKEVGIHLEA